MLERVLRVGERRDARDERHALLLRELGNETVDLLDVHHRRLGRTRDGGRVIEASVDALDVDHDGVIVVRLRKRRAHRVHVLCHHRGRDVIAGQLSRLRRCILLV